MRFNSSAAIFQQIAESLNDRILNGEYTAEERIPSIRETAGEMEVNPNTVTRAYNHLQESGTIYNKRGLGYFVSQDARNMILEKRRDQFLKHELPALFRSMDMLDLNISTIQKAYEKYKEENK